VPHILLQCAAISFAKLTDTEVDHMKHERELLTSAQEVSKVKHKASAVATLVAKKAIENELNAKREDRDAKVALEHEEYALVAVEAATAAAQVVKQAATTAVALSAAEAIVAMAVTAAAVAVAASHESAAVEAATSHESAAETLLSAQIAAAETLLVAKEAAQKTLLMAQKVARALLADAHQKGEKKSAGS
jgi:hypothetical protein